MKLLAIDPGTSQSAYIVFDIERKIPLHNGTLPNRDLQSDLTRKPPIFRCECMAIEQVTGSGMIAGNEIFETAYWSGVFCQAWEQSTGLPFMRIPRQTVKKHVLGKATGGDPEVTAALYKYYGGAVKGIGSKSLPGPMAGIKSHERSALAVAIAFCKITSPGTLFDIIQRK